MVTADFNDRQITPSYENLGSIPVSSGSWVLIFEAQFGKYVECRVRTASGTDLKTGDTNFDPYGSTLTLIVPVRPSETTTYGFWCRTDPAYSSTYSYRAQALAIKTGDLTTA